MIWAIVGYVTGLVSGVLLIAVWILYCVGDGVVKIFHDEQGLIRVRWEEQP